MTARARAGASLISCLLLALACAACASRDPNPAFPLTVDAAKEDLERMRDDPRPLGRPLIIAGGFLDPGIATHRIEERFAELTDTPDLVEGVVFFSSGSFETSAARLVGRVQERFPSDFDGWTTEVDVLGVSMGGLVALAAARDGGPDGRRLRIARLFTIGTPFRGANFAHLPSFDQRVVQMRDGSAFLDRVNDGLADAPFTIVPYVRLDDLIVGERNAAPEFATPWWVPNRPFEASHLDGQHDPRFTADIARRVRGEEPHTREPPEPLPTD